MIRRPTRVSEPRRGQSVSTQVAALNDRLEAVEKGHRQLRNTVAALAREVGVSLGCQCSHCSESYTLVEGGTMYCPRCGFRESL